MTPTIQPFQWIDRDTAARELLQLAYHAPPYIRDQAWKLLSAIRSPALIPELKAIVLDENSPHADMAFKAIVATPGNINFPEFEAAKHISLDNLVDLLEYYPINQDCIMRLIESRPPDEQLHLYWHILNYVPEAVLPRLIAIYDKQLPLLELMDAVSLYQTGSSLALNWLQAHWDEIIYLCLIYGIDRKSKGRPLFPFLEGWPELKTDLLRRCPVIQEQIEQEKLHDQNRRAQVRDVRDTPIWKRMEMLYEQALTGNREALSSLHKTSNPYHDDMVTAATATHFLGKLVGIHEPAFKECVHHLKFSYGYWFEPEFQGELYDSPIRHEAAFALSKIIRPEVWAVMIEACFQHPSSFLERQLHAWIACLTNQLSGATLITHGYMIPDVNRRPWFRSLLKPDLQSAAMYAEYYGVEQQPVETSSAG